MPEATVAAVILNDIDQILLTRRSHDPFKGFFCLPGGHIEPNEEALTAVIREVKEETGLDFQDVEFLTFNEEIYPGRNIHNIAICYIGEAEGQLTANDEVTEFMWARIDEACRMDLAFGHAKIIQTFLGQC